MGVFSDVVDEWKKAGPKEKLLIAGGVIGVAAIAYYVYKQGSSSSLNGTGTSGLPTTLQPSSTTGSGGGGGSSSGGSTGSSGGGGGTGTTTTTTTTPKPGQPYIIPPIPIVPGKPPAEQPLIAVPSAPAKPIASGTQGPSYTGYAGPPGGTNPITITPVPSAPTKPISSGAQGPGYTGYAGPPPSGPPPAASYNKGLITKQPTTLTKVAATTKHAPAPVKVVIAPPRPVPAPKPAPKPPAPMPPTHPGPGGYSAA